MSKIMKKATTALLPVPSVLATVGKPDGGANIITIAWTGILCSNPPTVYIAVQPVRFSHALLKESMDYVINIPTQALLKAVDFCGTVSGRDKDKFRETGLTSLPAAHVAAPLIQECPVNIECRVKDIWPLGSHDVFVGEVLAVHYSEEVLTQGVFDLKKMDALGYASGQYCATGEPLGRLGFTTGKA